jgi:vacuolar protein sorting-associated protein 41
LQILGTHSGAVHVLDLNGNRVREFMSHTNTVNDVCVDPTGDYVASCSDDGACALLLPLCT